MEPDAFADRLLEMGALSVDFRWTGARHALSEFGLSAPGAPGRATPEEARPLLAAGTAAAELFWRHAVLDVTWPDGEMRVSEASLELLGARKALAAKVVAAEDEDWAAAVRACKPTLLGQVAVVHASHSAEEVDALLRSVAPRPSLLTLDVGASFGFGDHPTTRLCGGWLLGSGGPTLAGANVLDYGCGTGVLGLGALLLGAATASGVDCDLRSLLLAQANAARNSLPLQLYASPDADPSDWMCVSFYSPSSALRGRTLFPKGPDASQRFDVVIANVTSDPLIRLAPRLGSSVAAGGWLAVSGFQTNRYEAVWESFHAAGVDLKIEAVTEDWVLAVGRA